MSPDEFRELGHHLVNRIADFLGSLPGRPVAPGESRDAVKALLGNRPLPERGEAAGPLLDRAADLLFDHSTFNGHPRFYGFITSSAAPLGALADLLAAAVNPNVGAWDLSPIASEIEAQTVSWIAELIGYPGDAGGLLVSGGNMANFVCFLAGVRARGGAGLRTDGLRGEPFRLYASKETHTWLEKAADLFGLGTDAISWIETDGAQRLRVDALLSAIETDRRAGKKPLLVVGTAGSVSTGAIDPLREVAGIARKNDLWFHVDGAYGGFAAALPDAPEDLKAIALADSVAVDPHKWLYAPLEAGCALVREAGALRKTFRFTPPYYPTDEKLNYHEHGMQNSRGFRALKVWLALQDVGREGYVEMIGDDIRLSKEMFRTVAETDALEPLTQALSIATFRYVPKDLTPGSPAVDRVLDELNAEILVRMQTGGEAFVSKAIVSGKLALRACIVNFRTSLEDVRALPALVVRLGREADRARRDAR